MTCTYIESNNYIELLSVNTHLQSIYRTQKMEK